MSHPSVEEPDAARDYWLEPGVSCVLDDRISALRVLLQAARGPEPVIVLSGPPGSGKTALLAELLTELTHDSVQVVRLLNPGPEPLSLRRMMAQVSGFDGVGGLTPGNVESVFQVLLSASHDSRHIVLAADDAHTLSPEMLNYLHLMVRLAATDGLLLQLILFGRPEIWDRLADERLQQLRQKIAIRREIRWSDYDEPLELGIPDITPLLDSSHQQVVIGLRPPVMTRPHREWRPHAATVALGVALLAITATWNETATWQAQVAHDSDPAVAVDITSNHSPDPTITTPGITAGRDLKPDQRPQLVTAPPTSAPPVVASEPAAPVPAPIAALATAPTAPAAPAVTAPPDPAETHAIPGATVAGTARAPEPAPVTVASTDLAPPPTEPPPVVTTPAPGSPALAAVPDGPTAPAPEVLPPASRDVSALAARDASPASATETPPVPAALPDSEDAARSAAATVTQPDPVSPSPAPAAAPSAPLAVVASIAPAAAAALPSATTHPQTGATIIVTTTAPVHHKPASVKSVRALLASAPRPYWCDKATPNTDASRVYFAEQCSQ